MANSIKEITENAEKEAKEKLEAAVEKAKNIEKFCNPLIMDSLFDQDI